MDQDTLPLYNCLLHHADTKPLSFHVPGHKNSTVFPILNDNVFKDLLTIDQTELTDLDDLHSPNGVIKEAQQLTAALYKVSSSYFLVGGSTAGNLAMILSTCEPADTVLVQRNSHKSIINGMKLANVHPVFLTPEYDSHGKFSTSVSYKTVDAAIKQYPNAKVLILTSPNYYGAVSTELRNIIELAHSNGLVVLVDEAHGAHLILGDPFPPSAVQLGADIVVQSAHKTLPAMTMGSFLHCNSLHIDIDRLQYYLQVIQSSSPSYPIMASLDIARYYLAHISQSEKINIMKQIDDFRKQISTIPQLKIIDCNSNENIGDPLKLIVQTRCELSGYRLQKEFEKQSIYTELADPWNVLFVLPLAVVEDWAAVTEKLKQAVQHLSVQAYTKAINKLEKDEVKISTLAVSYQEMNKLHKEWAPIQQAEGRIAAASIIPYPPGIPLVVEGEIITANHMEQLESLMKEGAYFQNKPDILKSGLEVFKL